MTVKILNGKALAKEIENELIDRVNDIKAKSNNKPPILATVLVGDDPASATYVRMKGNACKRVGMDSKKVLLPENTTTDELLNEIDKLLNIAFEIYNNEELSENVRLGWGRLIISIMKEKSSLVKLELLERNREDLESVKAVLREKRWKYEFEKQENIK